MGGGQYIWNTDMGSFTLRNNIDNYFGFKTKSGFPSGFVNDHFKGL